MDGYKRNLSGVPEHYRLNVQGVPCDVHDVVDALDPPHYVAEALTYLMRYRRKPSENPDADLSKAAHVLLRQIFRGDRDGSALRGLEYVARELAELREASAAAGSELYGGAPLRIRVVDPVYAYADESVARAACCVLAHDDLAEARVCMWRGEDEGMPEEQLAEQVAEVARGRAELRQRKRDAVLKEFDKFYDTVRFLIGQYLGVPGVREDCPPNGIRILTKHVDEVRANVHAYAQKEDLYKAVVACGYDALTCVMLHLHRDGLATVVINIGGDAWTPAHMFDGDVRVQYQKAREDAQAEFEVLDKHVARLIAKARKAR